MKRIFLLIVFCWASLFLAVYDAYPKTIPDKIIVKEPQKPTFDCGKFRRKCKYATIWFGFKTRSLANL